MPLMKAQWLHYLLRKLLHSTKSLRKPRAKPKATVSSALRPTRVTRRVAIPAPAARGKAQKDDPLTARVDRAYAALVKAEDCLALSLGKGRKGKKTGVQLGSAQEVMAWGREMDWIRR